MDPTIKGILIGLFVGAVLSLLSFGFSRLGKRQDVKTDAEIRALETAKLEVENQRKVVEQLQLEMAVLKAEAKPINAAYLAMLVAKSTHFHTPVMDALLAKLGPPSALTEAECEELKLAIQERMVDMGPEIDHKERISVELIPSVSQLADIEHEELKNAQMETILVSQPVTEPTNGKKEEAE